MFEPRAARQVRGKGDGVRNAEPRQRTAGVKVVARPATLGRGDVVAVLRVDPDGVAAGGGLGFDDVTHHAADLLAPLGDGRAGGAEDRADGPDIAGPTVAREHAVQRVHVCHRVGVVPVHRAGGDR